MLENLRKLNIESTLPVMENTIQRHELKSL